MLRNLSQSATPQRKPSTRRRSRTRPTRTSTTPSTSRSGSKRPSAGPRSGCRVQDPRRLRRRQTDGGDRARRAPTGPQGAGAARRAKGRRWPTSSRPSARRATSPAASPARPAQGPADRDRPGSRHRARHHPRQRRPPRPRDRATTRRTWPGWARRHLRADQRIPSALSRITSSAFSLVTNCGPVGMSEPLPGKIWCRVCSDSEDHRQVALQVRLLVDREQDLAVADRFEHLLAEVKGGKRVMRDRAPAALAASGTRAARRPAERDDPVHRGSSAIASDRRRWAGRGILQRHGDLAGSSRPSASARPAARGSARRAHCCPASWFTHSARLTPTCRPAAHPPRRPALYSGCPMWASTPSAL